MTNTEIANEILKQLGGSRTLNLMLGLKTLNTVERGLSFSFKCRSKINYVKITLNGKDLYDVEMGKIRACKYKVIKEEKDIYCDMLVNLIEETSGLSLRVPRVIFS